MALRVYATVRVCDDHRDEFQQTFPDAKIEEGDRQKRHECDVLNPGGDNCQNIGFHWKFGLVLVNPAKSFARLGGLTKSPARAAASKDNGKKGGRPKKRYWVKFHEKGATLLDADRKMTLEEVQPICRQYEVRADLLDDDRNKVGAVDSDGRLVFS